MTILELKVHEPVVPVLPNPSTRTLMGFDRTSLACTVLSILLCRKSKSEELEAKR